MASFNGLDTYPPESQPRVFSLDYGKLEAVLLISNIDELWSLECLDTFQTADMKIASCVMLY